MFKEDLKAYRVERGEVKTNLLSGNGFDCRVEPTPLVFALDGVGRSFAAVTVAAFMPRVEPEAGFIKTQDLKGLAGLGLSGCA